MRKAAFLAATLTALMAATGAASGGERLDLGSGVRKADDPLVAAMDAAAAKSGMDGIVLVSIASVVEDAQAMRLSRTINGPAPPPATQVRAVMAENERSGVYGFDDDAWLKVAPPLVSVARSDERSAPLRPKAASAGQRRILDLRRDPVFATEVAAAALHGSIPAFRASLGRDPSPGEILDIHLFGVDAAVRLTRAALKDARTSSVAAIGPAAKRPALRIFLTSTDGRILSARALVLSSEIVMAIKAKIARRYLGRLRA